MQKSESFENLIKEGQKKNEAGDTLRENIHQSEERPDEPV